MTKIFSYVTSGKSLDLNPKTSAIEGAGSFLVNYFLGRVVNIYKCGKYNCYPNTESHQTENQPF